ncbi:MAG: toll/interleukin-1 receptor domain-containing protein [Candidatus Loosdrechtia sp.]|uniref:toll/interleukin-1 receptor domain-containing protein n=1 Tax=Candidatus Loosdrechtia sp. TaxID=3101272 RepID=UPI00403A935C
MSGLERLKAWEKPVLVFISHSSEDKELYIKPIVSELNSCGIEVWIDNQRILPGYDLWESIREGLDRADMYCYFLQNIHCSLNG